jgi:meso-butanediol dehydrogenase/(S,S)-butanediol dehydrogenase/diacetyl reductase
MVECDKDRNEGKVGMGSRVVVFGAAGGIGIHVVHEMQNAGYTCFGVDVNTIEQSVEIGNITPEMAAFCGDDYQHAVADATSAEQVADAVAQAGDFQHVVTLVGGALPGEQAATRIDDVPIDALADTVERNLMSALFIARSALPVLREQPGDKSFTMTSSINAKRALGLFAYSASKSALTSLAQNLAASEGPSGVRVNVVAPGTVVTPRTERLWAPKVGHFEQLQGTTFLGRTTTMAEAAAAYRMLAVDLKAVTGTVLSVDAGQSAKWLPG